MKHPVCLVLSVPILIASLVLPCPAAQAPKTVTLMSYGGDYEKLIPTLFGPLFEKETGYALKYIGVGNEADMVSSIKAQAGNQIYDVIVANEGHLVAAKDLWQPVDAKYLSNMGQMYDIAKVPNNFIIRAFSGGVTVVYNSKVFQEKGWAPPASWMDFWDPKFKRHVVTPDATSSLIYGLAIIAAEINGGSEKNLEPAWPKFRALAPSIVTFASASAKVSDLFAQGAAWIAIHTEGSAVRWRRAGLPIGTARPKEGTIFVPACAALVKGGPNPDGGQKLINFLLSARAQKAWSESFGYGPLNKTVQLPADLASQITYGPEQVSKFRVINWELYNQILPKFVDRWNREVAAK